ncbi:hypothetical protein ACWCP6_10030 [Streptomyces sp. NPDC002004]
MATALVAGSILVAVGEAAQAESGDVAAAVTDTANLDHAKKVEPLNAVADALGEQGRRAYSGVYSSLYVDEHGGRVTLYVTDAHEGRKLVDAAKAAHPDIDTGLIEVATAKYAKKALDAQAEQILKDTAVGRAADVSVYSVSVNPDGSGITVSGNSDKLHSIKSKIHADNGEAPVTVVAGEPVHAASWRWNDGAPQIGGDVLLGPSHRNGFASQCTAGLALENSVGGDSLVTAAHCFRNGTDVYGEGDSVGHFGYRYGVRIGHVVNTNDRWDAQLIETNGHNGAGTNSDEADAHPGKWYRVKGTAYSYSGQSVCQDGARSYYTGHGVPCGITVQNADVRYNLTWEDGSVHAVRGVKGHNSNWAVTKGDSGALVFSVTNRTDRKARGIVSGESGNQTMYWTEAPDIIDAFGVDLNPHT